MIIAMVEGATRVIGKSQGYLGLPLRDETVDCSVNGPIPTMVSAWEPTPDEIERIKAGAKIYLRVMGTAHPPVLIEVGEATHVDA